MLAEVGTQGSDPDQEWCRRRRPDSGQLRPIPGQCRPSFADVGQIWSKVSKVYQIRVGRIWDKIGRCLVNSMATRSSLGRFPENVVRKWARSGRCWSRPGRSWSNLIEFGRSWPNSARIEFAEVGRTSSGSGRIWSGFGPISAARIRPKLGDVDRCWPGVSRSRPAFQSRPTPASGWGKIRTTLNQDFGPPRDRLPMGPGHGVRAAWCRFRTKFWATPHVRLRTHCPHVDLMSRRATTASRDCESRCGHSATTASHRKGGEDRHPDRREAGN